MASGAGGWRALCTVLQRKRVFAPDQLHQGNLKRCLSLWDLCCLGVARSLGAGLYVVVGAVALQVAGPAVVLSFLIAAVASLFAGLCYAEMGARVPRAGSAYIYAYVTVGELLAFLVGWNMLLEGIVGTASVAKGLSTYLDSMLGGAMSRWFVSSMPIGSPLFSEYFDLFAFSLVLLLGVLLATGVRQSSSVNNVCVTLSMLVVLFIIIAGAVKVDVRNWSLPPEDVPSGWGAGGFLPYGGWGVLRGAALAFYGFVGIDVITHSGEEALQPRRTVPWAILWVLALLSAVYMAVGAVLTLMVPYYDLDKVAAVATAFTYVGWDWARWIVSIGAVFGIFSSVYGCLYPVGRLLYAMSCDSLLPHQLGRLTRGAPSAPTLLSAAVVAVLAGCLQLQQLVVLLCAGSLLAYTVVATCVIVLRYRCKQKSDGASWRGVVRQALGCGRRESCADVNTVVSTALLVFICVCVATALVGTKTAQPLVPVLVLHSVALALLVIISVQPQAPQQLTFKTPFMPLVPCLSIYVNIQLMVLLNVDTWIRVLVWMAIGLPVYIICLLCYKRNKANLDGKDSEFAPTDKDGKSTVQIIVESPTPPDTLNKVNALDTDIIYESDHKNNNQTNENNLESNKVIKHIEFIEPYIADEIIVQQAVIENHEEKEAKIIDLLDQVLQAEEENYPDIISLKETREDIVANIADRIQRKSLSELSDAGSDASGQVLSKYDVIALVHREDLPKVNEEDNELKNCYNKELIDIEKLETEDANNNIEDREIEHLTEIHDEDSETNSRTDESGYSDTLDKYVLTESIEGAIESPINIPEPPPLDENYFASPKFKKAHTISSRPSRKQELELELHEEENKPRESVLSNTSLDNNNIVFGSARQMSFMSKLNNIFQTKISAEPDDKLKRSNSTGNFADEGLTIIRERPAIFLDLKKELQAMGTAPNLRSVNAITKDNSKLKAESVEDVNDNSLSREDLKSKLESILTIGGPTLVKPRVMKSNPPTPEEAYQTDSSSTESIPKKLPKMEKNDTLKRQKDKFGEVLNSLRLSLNKDEVV